MSAPTANPYNIEATLNALFQKLITEKDYNFHVIAPRSAITKFPSISLNHHSARTGMLGASHRVGDGIRNGVSTPVLGLSYEATLDISGWETYTNANWQESLRKIQRLIFGIQLRYHRVYINNYEGEDVIDAEDLAEWDRCRIYLKPPMLMTPFSADSQTVPTDPVNPDLVRLRMLIGYQTETRSFEL